MTKFGAVTSRQVTRWQRYWFDEGGRLSLAIVRIAVACSVLLVLKNLAYVTTGRPLLGQPQLYRPVGVWMLFGDNVPPLAVVDVLWVVAVAGALAMLVGLATRVSTVVSFVASLALVSLSFAESRTWSHQYNVVMLSHMAMLGSRSGDTLSIDWLIRRLRGLPPIDIPRAYQWSLRLVQLAVALMFAGAVFHKLLYSHFTLRWALSDNLRHHLLVKYDLADMPRPWLADWLLQESWRYRSAALLNMISQAAPIAAVIFARRPWVRAAAGVFFLGETIALELVMQLWNYWFLPLAAVFIDWDRLIGWITKRGTSVPVLTKPFKPPRAIRIWIGVFITYQLVTSFVPTLDQRLNTYPFSGFPMFATLRARAPYDTHQPYSVPGDSFEAISERPILPSIKTWLDHAYRFTHLVRRPDELRGRLQGVLEAAKRAYPDYGFHGIRLWHAIYETPAYPAPGNFERHETGILGELHDDGTFHSLLGKLRGTPGEQGARIELPPRDYASAKVFYFRDDKPAPIELPARISGNTIDLSRPIEGHPLYFVVEQGGKRWFVASYKPWKW